jgi:hypothetical protein
MNEMHPIQISVMLAEEITPLHQRAFDKSHNTIVHSPLTSLTKMERIGAFPNLSNVLVRCHEFLGVIVPVALVNPSV